MFITVRNITTEDLHNLYSINKDIDVNALADIFIHNEESCFGAFHNKRCVGYLLAQCKDTLCTINKLFITEMKEKEKTSQFLHKALEDYTEKSGIKNISIDIESSEKDTIDFFTKKGYAMHNPIIHLIK